MGDGGKVDEKLEIITMCKEFSWTYQEYLNRPLWFDGYYALKLKAEAKYQEVKNQTHE